ncbi:response regulator transcription factor [Lachnospiraceae bacterium 48-42]
MHIMIIEDDLVIRQELRQLLENSLYQVSAPGNFEGIVPFILERDPDLVLLDLNLPGESGFEICSKLRLSSEVPVIFVTGRTDSMDELNGILRGGDDYITKPFHPPVLLARIAAVLKRTKRNTGREEAVLSHKGVELDLARGCVRYECREIDMSRNELKILHYLFMKKGEIVSRMELVEALWDQQVFIDDNALSVNMTRIRGKLARIGVQEFIETKRGMGYRI